jgi:hypothetical protein
MSLSNLRPWFDPISDTADHKQLATLHAKFINDFVTNPFTLNGKAIRVIERASGVGAYSQYGQTFFHLISREVKLERWRIYEGERANRIHWIKPILQSHPTGQILYYKWMDARGICKEHFWLFSKDYMVVTKEVEPNVQIVTAFCVDKDAKSTYFERYKNFKDGGATC